MDISNVKLKKEFILTEKTSEEVDFQLVIIGNGFDLECGLKTSFNDYLSFKRSEIKVESPSKAKLFLSLSEQNDLNLFDFILNETSIWADLEASISRFLSDSNKKGSLFSIFVNCLRDNYYSCLHQKEKNQLGKKGFCEKTIYNISKHLRSLNLNNNCTDFKYIIVEALMKELNALEELE